jgi:hypothetical protein
VLPVEDSRHYSESILYLPPSYQISLYDATDIDALERSYLADAHNSRYSSLHQQQQLKDHLRMYVFLSFFVMFLFYYKNSCFFPSYQAVWLASEP